jgi:hypothetical protein
VILAIAPGSSGHYRIDEDGNIYTARYYDERDVPPGQRPTGRETMRSGGRTFWLPTGQVEELTDEQRVELFGPAEDPPQVQMLMAFVALCAARGGALAARRAILL